MDHRNHRSSKCPRYRHLIPWATKDDLVLRRVGAGIFIAWCGVVMVALWNAKSHATHSDEIQPMAHRCHLPETMYGGVIAERAPEEGVWLRAAEPPNSAIPSFSGGVSIRVTSISASISACEGPEALIKNDIVVLKTVCTISQCAYVSGPRKVAKNCV